MNAIFLLFVAELFAFGLMWHNKSARSGQERESEKPDPAVLFSTRNRKQSTVDSTLKRQLAKTESTVSGLWLDMTRAVVAIWNGARKQNAPAGDLVPSKGAPATQIDTALK